ncbi:hypothetical protein CRM22_003902 [Opisthorchis felineus]|uniref:Uncharacterized protein n=1 Tax=Opisthorchis felineus TaxID=147828 RepID=A0A4S2LYW6_OPIFE|nr:hypothetical protein CRM22_003902 [Opisthorchis felineus]
MQNFTKPKKGLTPEHLRIGFLNLTCDKGSLVGEFPKVHHLHQIICRYDLVLVRGLNSHIYIDKDKQCIKKLRTRLVEHGFIEAPQYSEETVEYPVVFFRHKSLKANLVSTGDAEINYPGRFFGCNIIPENQSLPKFLLIVPIRMQSGRLPTDENLYAVVDYLYNDYQNIMVITAFEDKEDAMVTQRLSSRIIGERFCWLLPLHPNTSTVGDSNETDQLLIYGDDLKKSVHNKITRTVDLRSILNLAAEELHVKIRKASYILLDGIKSCWRNTTMWAKVDSSDEDTEEDSDIPSEPAELSGSDQVDSSSCDMLNPSLQYLETYWPNDNR